MASFTTRMVLHDADWDDYSSLYDAMGVEGFTDIITSDDGISYKMPDGEYNISGSYTRSEVFEKAKRAAEKTNKEYAVLVTESKGRNWRGLEKI